MPAAKKTVTKAPAKKVVAKVAPKPAAKPTPAKATAKAATAKKPQAAAKPQTKKKETPAAASGAPAAPWENGQETQAPAAKVAHVKVAPVVRSPAEQAAHLQAMFTLLGQWNEMKKYISEQMKPYLDKEREIRQTLFDGLFPDAEEGTNYFELSDGWKLKAEYPVERTFDQPLMPAAFEGLPPEYQTPGHADCVIRWKPEVNTKVFKALVQKGVEGDKEAAAHASKIEMAIVSKPGSVTLTLVPPKA